MHGHCAQAAPATFNICSQMFKYIVFRVEITVYAAITGKKGMIDSNVAPV